MNLSQKFNEEDLENSGCDYGKIATAVGKMKKPAFLLIYQISISQILLIVQI